ncbi:hypothetical protein EmuJ_000005900 [Echinococcus multilocularis]|uniref:Uncharacterized protein n=1 Tax=Echinococcus multilocularis TaxID=6211 RepID=A0A087VWB5_ECHMU|nr:hypothetical protein EmuJ_000005900 [Echinococcus multilocularis]
MRTVNACYGKALCKTRKALLLARQKRHWFDPGSNWGPSACEADVITTTPPNRVPAPPSALPLAL